MQRFVALVGLVFAIASLLGMSVAHAHRYQTVPVKGIVVLNHVDADNIAIPVFVKVQRGNIDLGSGIVMPCGQLQAVVPVLPTLPQPPHCALPAPVEPQASLGWQQTPPIRPPKTA